MGRRKPQNELPSAPAYQDVEDEGAAAAASSRAFELQKDQEPGGESLRGAMALVDIPQKGNNVSCIIIKVIYA